MAVLVSYTVYRKRYLDPLNTAENSPTDSLEVRRTNGHTCDALDLRVIAALFNSTEASIRNVAGETRIPRTTFEYRMERLKEKGIISNRCFILDPIKLGIPQSRILIQTQNLDISSREKFLSYCAEHPTVVSLRHTLGEWEYGLTIESENPKMVFEIYNEITSQFLGQIQKAEILNVVNQKIPASFLKHN